MLLVKENHTDSKMLYTEEDRPHGLMMNEAGRHAMEAADKSKIEGIVVMPTVVPDPPEAGGVEAASKIGKESPPRNAGTVA